MNASRICLVCGNCYRLERGRCPLCLHSPERAMAGRCSCGKCPEKKPVPQIKTLKKKD